MGILSTEYSAFKVTDARVQIWQDGLSGISSDAILAATKRYMMGNNSFPPNIGQIYNSALEIQNGADMLPSPEGAWMIVLDVIKRKKEHKSIPREIKTALKATGDLYTLRQKSSLDSDRTFFLNAYRSILRRQSDNRQLSGIAKMNRLL